MWFHWFHVGAPELQNLLVVSIPVIYPWDDPLFFPLLFRGVANFPGANRHSWSWRVAPSMRSGAKWSSCLELFGQALRNLIAFSPDHRYHIFFIGPQKLMCFIPSQHGDSLYDSVGCLRWLRDRISGLRGVSYPLAIQHSPGKWPDCRWFDIFNIFI